MKAILGRLVLAATTVPFLVAASTSSGGDVGDVVTIAACLECHDDVANALVRTHAAVNCGQCHSNGAAHLEDPDALPGHAESSSCLSCHQSDQATWAFSHHSAAGVSCGDCHGVHEPKEPIALVGAMLVKDATSSLCLSCHQEVVPRLNMASHHPIKEGAVSCVSCHNPHQSAAMALAAQAESCTGCHQSVRGPHVFEHVPAAEGCASCHDPHGSPHAKLLQVAQPMLCLQCHSIADNRHGQTGAAGSRIGGVALRNCTGCHAAVHGSGFDQHLRF